MWCRHSTCSAPPTCIQNVVPDMTNTSRVEGVLSCQRPDGLGAVRLRSTALLGLISSLALPSIQVLRGTPLPIVCQHAERSRALVQPTRTTSRVSPVPFSSDGSSLTSRLNVRNLPRNFFPFSAAKKLSLVALAVSNSKRFPATKTRPIRVQGRGPWPQKPEALWACTCPKQKSTKPGRGTRVPSPGFGRPLSPNPFSGLPDPSLWRPWQLQPQPHQPLTCHLRQNQPTHPTHPLHRPQGHPNTSARCVAVLLLDPTSPVQPTPPSPETELHTQVAFGLFPCLGSMMRRLAPAWIPKSFGTCSGLGST